MRPQPRISIKVSLFSGGKTTALTDTISGLDDFELISFLVIQEAG